jgi:hypothetical protein
MLRCEAKYIKVRPADQMATALEKSVFSQAWNRFRNEKW